MKKLNLLLLLTLSFQAFCSDISFVSKETRKERKAREKLEAIKLNTQTIGNIRITKDTVFCFDLHKVVADYDIKRMLYCPSLLIPAVTFLGALRYFPKSTLGTLGILTLAYADVIKHIAKKGTLGSEEIQWRLAQKYPWNWPVNNLFKLGFNIAAKLKPIDGTIKIAQELMNQGYKVIFLSNIEPALWQRFIQDFPMFKDCEVFNPRPEDNWDRKPNRSFFEKFKVWAKARNYNNNFFIDDKFVNNFSANSCGIPSYTFTTAQDLFDALLKMGVELPQNLLDKQ